MSYVLPPSLTADGSTVSFPCVCVCVCVCVCIACNSPPKALLYLLSTVAHGCQRMVAGWCSVIAVEDIFLPPSPSNQAKQIEELFVDLQILATR